jgi:hypothetical protein
VNCRITFVSLEDQGPTARYPSANSRTCSSEERSERAGLERAVEAMLKIAHVIPLDTAIFNRASGIQIALDMSSTQDSIILASIVSHLLETKPPESCFLNRNTKDFDDPNVREILDGFGCKFFGRFDDGLRYIEARLRA